VELDADGPKRSGGIVCGLHRKLTNIPAKANRKQTFSFSRWVYRQRNQVERFFNRIKQMRGLATRYDRRADNYLAALKLAATRIWIASFSESAP
jgi:transposase